MISIAFPNMFTSIATNLTNDYDASLQNLETLIKSEKNEMFGDPYFGTNLKKFLYDQNDVILQDLLIDDLYVAIAEFMPQLIVKRGDISIEVDMSKIIIHIKALNRLNFETNMYNIVLTSE